MLLCSGLFTALLSACPGQALTCLPLLQLHTRCSSSAQHSTSHIANTSLAMQTQQACKLACWCLIVRASWAEWLKGSVSVSYPSKSYWTWAQASRETNVLTLNWNNVEVGSITVLAPLDEHNKKTVEYNITIQLHQLQHWWKTLLQTDAMDVPESRQ